MYKFIYQLPVINKSMSLKFNLILRDNEDKQQNNFNKLIDKFHMNDSDYLRVNAHPYLTVDISSKKEKKTEGYDYNSTVSLNRQCVFKLITALKRQLKKLSTEDLFFYRNNKLVLNTQLASNLIETFPSSNKHIMIMHAVVRDEENPDDDYEGIAFLINSMANYCLLTIDEVSYLIYILEHFDMDNMVMQAIQLASTMKGTENREIEIPKNPVNEVINKEEVVSNFTSKKPKDEIPDL